MFGPWFVMRPLEALACACGALYGAPGWALLLSGRPWAGLLFLALGCVTRHWVLGRDLDG